MMNRTMLRAGVLCTAISAALGLTIEVSGEVLELTLRVVDSEQTFAPLHSAVHAEHAGDLMFFGGLENMGLHGINGHNPDGGFDSFPLKRYNNDVIIFNPDTGVMSMGTLTNLSDTVRTALLVNNAAARQDGSTLYIYGGFGPLLDNSDWNTRETIVSVDLDAVRTAVLASAPIPEAAFTLTTNTETKVAGAKIINMGGKFALIGGADFLFDYGFNGLFYAERMQIFDIATSHLAQEQTIIDTVNLHRRDMNAHPVTYSDGKGGFEYGFAVTGGVFNNIFPFTNPLTYRVGDASVVDHAPAEQMMNVYESPSVSFYRATEDRNRFVMFSGISANHYDRETDTFTYDFLSPWSREITEIRMEAGAFVAEIIMDDMVDPTTNAELILEDNIPTGLNGQVMLDMMPAGEVLLGRIYGGLKSSAEGHTPPFGGTATTWASTTIHDVFLTVGVRGDINRNGVTDAVDLGLLLADFGGSGISDLNLDGVVDTADLGILITNFGSNMPG